MTWRYVHRDRIRDYELAGWINADRYEKMRNKYFVLMLWEGTNGQH